MSSYHTIKNISNFPSNFVTQNEIEFHFNILKMFMTTYMYDIENIFFICFMGFLYNIL